MSEDEAIEGLLPHIPSAGAFGQLDPPISIPAPALFQRLCGPGTRKELLGELDEWANSRGQWGSKPVFLLTGGPYTGKSTIAAELCRRLRYSGRLGAAFFCVEGWDVHSEVAWSLDSLVATTLAVQLARSQPVLYEPILQAARAASTHDPSDVRWAFEELIRLPLETLPIDHPPICIIVDAVDGGNADSAKAAEWQARAREFLQLLVSCATKVPSQLRIFVTSRQGPILRSWGGAPFVHTVSLHAFSSSALGDVRTLFLSELGVYDWSRSWSVEHPDQVDKLAEKAHGWYLYARAASSFLLESRAVFLARVALLVSDTPHPPPATDARFQPLTPFAEHLWKQFLWPVMRTRWTRTRPTEEESAFLSTFVGYIPDPSEPHRVTPRVLALLSGRPGAAIMSAFEDILQPLVVSRSHPTLGADSELELLHPVCRDIIAARYIGHPIDTARIPISTSSMHVRLTVACAHAILSPLRSTTLQVPISVSELARYARAYPPPPVPDVGDIEFAFKYLRDHPIGPDILASVQDDREASELRQFISLDDAVLDELYLWLCVTPR